MLAYVFSMYGSIHCDSFRAALPENASSPRERDTLRCGFDRNDSTTTRLERSLPKAPVPSGGAMQSFIHRKNLENFRKLLTETTDEVRRKQIQTLLREEQAKDLSALRQQNDE